MLMCHEKVLRSITSGVQIINNSFILMVLHKVEMKKKSSKTK